MNPWKLTLKKICSPGGLVDSVGLVRLVAYLKEELGIAIPPKDLLPGNFRSVSAISGYLRNL